MEKHPPVWVVDSSTLPKALTKKNPLDSAGNAKKKFAPYFYGAKTQRNIYRFSHPDYTVGTGLTPVPAARRRQPTRLLADFDCR